MGAPRQVVRLGLVHYHGDSAHIFTDYWGLVRVRILLTTYVVLAYLFLQRESWQNRDATISEHALSRATVHKTRQTAPPGTVLYPHTAPHCIMVLPRAATAVHQ